MRGLAFVSLFLLSASLWADELGLEQLIAQMESKGVRQAGSPPVESIAVQSDVGLRLEQMVALATTNDVRLAPYSSALKLAQYRSDASVQYDNPELRLGTELNGDDPGQKASVRFYPPNPWQVRAEKGENSAVVGAENAAYQSALLETTIDVTFFCPISITD